MSLIPSKEFKKGQRIPAMCIPFLDVVHGIKVLTRAWYLHLIQVQKQYMSFPSKRNSCAHNMYTYTWF